MTDLTLTLTEALAEVKPHSDWNGAHFLPTLFRAEIRDAIATILNAVLSGDLIPRADAEMAVAEAIRRAADLIVSSAYTSNGDRRSLEPVAESLRGADQHHATIAAAIHRIAPADALAEVQRLREERDSHAKQGAEWASIAADNADRAEKAEAERDAALARVEKLREARRDQMEARVEAVLRRNFVAPEDAAVEALCLRFGYGAVMDAASRLWARTDMLGAFYVGGCIGFRTEEEARAALDEDARHG